MKLEEAKETQARGNFVEIRDVPETFLQSDARSYRKTEYNETDQQWLCSNYFKKTDANEWTCHELVVSSPTITSLIDRDGKKGASETEDCKDAEEK